MSRVLDSCLQSLDPKLQGVNLQGGSEGGSDLPNADPGRALQGIRGLGS